MPRLYDRCRARVTPAIGGRHGNLQFPPARRPHPVAKTVAQGQWRAPPADAGHARARAGPVALMAVAFPILPGKTDEWRTWMVETPLGTTEDPAVCETRGPV